MNWTLFLSLSFLAIVLQAIFAVFEMASVSFNRVRLQYYVSQGRKRAIWLDHLLKRPSRLFGTTLIGINTALQLGSECSRRFYEAIHLNPDFAPLTQVVLVVIFAELVPLFAAMRHPEQIVMFLVPMMIALSKVLMPLTWAFDGISKLGHWIMRKPVETRLFLSREEVKTAFSEKEKQDEITKVTSQIFKLKSMTAKDLMISLNKVPMVSSFGTVEEVKRLIS
ncbi:MAG: DUF21 domain-containing protein, partial [Chlamydiae bacterium]|nr:DUF21 domain-containing protein [Chlamydiota bacterium]